MLRLSGTVIVEIIGIYIWTMILSYFVLKKKMTLRKAIGAIGIVAGAIVMAG
jgi:uncharacterized membrane protein